MKRFIQHFISFAAVLLFAFASLEVPIQWNYDCQIAASADWQCLEGINAEVLIVGNSRVESGFDPTQIEATTGLSTFVLAQTGWQAKLLKSKLRNYLKVNTPPKVLIIQADPIHLGTRSDWYAKSNFLKYLFFDREDLYTTMKDYTGFHAYEFWIPFIRYRGVPGRYVRDAFNIPLELDKVKGYKPNGGMNRHEPIPAGRMTLSFSNIAMLDAFYSESPKSKRLAVFPLVSPELYERIDGLETLRSYSREREIQFLDLNTIIAAKPDSIYSNHTHANVFGAKLQTEQLSSAINALQLP